MRNLITVDDELKIETAEPRLLITARSYRWKYLSAWNSLPDELRFEVSIKKFKVGLKTWIKERQEDLEGDRSPDLIEEV